jgi:hypothetical protein
LMKYAFWFERETGNFERKIRIFYCDVESMPNCDYQSANGK